jgi:integrase
MPKKDPRRGWRPKPYHHRRKGEAVGRLRVRIDGVSHYLGRWDDPAAWSEYDRLMAEWSAGDYARPAPKSQPTVAEMLGAYLDWAEPKYGKKNAELYNLKSAIRPVRELYGQTLIADFGPPALKAVRAHYVALGWSRSTVNAQVGRLRRVFRWGLEMGYVPPGVLERLQAVQPLREGDTEAPETEDLLPVEDAVVEKTLPELKPEVRDMVQLQRLTGMRPGEVCAMKAGEIDRTSYLPEWLFEPKHHKTRRKGKRRRIFFGPKAQALLLPYLERAGADPEARVFRNRSGRPWLEETYRRRIERACERAGIDHWSPNQLRKTKATEVELKYNLEHAKATLGHSKSNITAQHYARADDEMARRVARETG